ncbi:hypothetical protein GP486_008655 [Trichoglossum hirsutum]|uniref:LisH domain-containing protein n=1 Tax=Trichoglossum hirsutum TaxID=265104 RepID=A0A9P8L3L0_9PEZI|nr:hypothetical protein GP486_008655 [Trichoglossum hirsutum]
MNNMSMAGMNSVGGPVGGMPMMNNGTGGQRDDNIHNNNDTTLLNTYIYDYFLKNGLHSCARSLLNSNAPLKTASDGPNQRTSPNMRRDADGNVLGNGVDENAMDTGDSKDGGNGKREDLPDAKVPQDCPTNSFLFDWWCVFWEMFGAQRKGGRNGEGGGAAMAYMQHTQAQQRIRQEQQRMMLGHRDPQMVGSMSQYQNQMMMRSMQNGMNMSQNDMARTAMQNSRKS